MTDQDPNVEPDDVDTDPVDDNQDDDASGVDKLGDAGKQALDRMKAKLKASTAKQRDLEKQLADAKKPPADGDKVDAEKIRDEAKAEAKAELLKGRALDKVEAKAAKLFADPEDAVALLASQVDDFIDDGEIDLDAINEAIEKLLKKKPHLAAQGGKKFGGGADGGARNGSGKPGQLTENDLKNMSPQEIVKARQDGRLADLLGAS